MKIKIMICGLLFYTNVLAMQSVGEVKSIKKIFLSRDIEKIQQVMDSLNSTQQVFYLSLPELQKHIKAIGGIESLQLKRDVIKNIFFDEENKTNQDLKYKMLLNNSNQDINKELEEDIVNDANRAQSSKDEHTIIQEHSDDKCAEDKCTENAFITALHKNPIKILSSASILSAGLALAFNKMIMTRMKDKEKKQTKQIKN